jgi:hypothetical protein
MTALSSDPVSMLPFDGSQHSPERLFGSQQELVSSQDHDETSSCQDEREALRSEPTVERPDSSQSEILSSLPVENNGITLPPILRHQESSPISKANVISSSVNESVVKSFSSTPGYLANRWNSINSSFSTPPRSQFPASITPPR